MKTKQKFTMYPHNTCFVCGVKKPVMFMPMIEGKHPMCNEHYRQAIMSKGINMTKEEILITYEEQDDYRRIFTTYVNRIGKYEKLFNIKLIDNMILEHKKQILLINKDISSLTQKENNDIITYLRTIYLKEIIPFVVDNKELLSVRLSNSKYQYYYYKLTGNKVRSRESYLWQI